MEAGKRGTKEGAAEASKALVRFGDELLPLAMGAEVVVGNGEGGWSGREGSPQESHPGFSRCMAGLPQVARKAAADDVIPFMSTPSALGKDVVEGDVLGFTSTVLTGEFVAIEHLEAREALLQARALHELGEADYRRNGDRGAYGVQLTAAVLDYFCFAVEDQYHGPANPAYVEWFKVLVQDQHRDIGQIH